MGKISNEAKKRYSDTIREYKTTIEKIKKREESLRQIILNDDLGGDYKRMMLADESLNMVSYYILINSLSMALLGIKNDDYLNLARKGCYKCIISIEEVITNFIDVPFSDYEENLARIEAFSDEDRWKLICKLGYSIQAVEEGFGENSKWKWDFVEIEGRYTTIVKNMINLKTMLAGMDPRVPGYEIRTSHLRLVKKLLQKASDRYRQKYELSTLRIDDFKLAISYLAALRRLTILLGDTADSESLKKKIEIWRTKMENDLKKREKKPGKK